MAPKPCTTELPDAQWAAEPLLPAAKPGGRPRSANLREFPKALLYQNRTGRQRDLLPHDLPGWAATAGDGPTDRRTDGSEATAQLGAMHLMLRRLDPSDAYLPFRYCFAA